MGAYTNIDTAKVHQIADQHFTIADILKQGLDAVTQSQEAIQQHFQTQFASVQVQNAFNDWLTIAPQILKALHEHAENLHVIANNYEKMDQSMG